jgi:hypothetical protein
MTQKVDPRGQRLAAGVASAVLAGALLTAPGPIGIGLLVVQAALFATAVLQGVHRTPVAALFRRVVRPRLGPPRHLEEPEAPRFAQAVGLVFAAVALLAFVGGATTVGYLATAAALVAAMLNAAIGLCLGCELYPLARGALVALAVTPRSDQGTTTGTARRIRSTT